ncbi:WhiB family transcriptional regulator [Kitasatospora camelliae]|uniref:Transcriptional regulator WhiB n=1 Tax=Kitasatospora camelliae TaxID=3156397 RepID=A0AAU8K9G4_9ACTN
MARFVRRGLRGTARPHLTARPTGPVAVEVIPSSAGSLPGAACKGVDPDLFFAEVDPDDTDADPDAVDFAVRRVKAVCAGCPVKELCLTLALVRVEPHGVFGGLTAAERRALKKSLSDGQRAPRHVAVAGVSAGGAG